jgi:hypothetical protein
MLKFLQRISTTKDRVDFQRFKPNRYVIDKLNNWLGNEKIDIRLYGNKIRYYYNNYELSNNTIFELYEDGDVMIRGLNENKM